MTEVAHHLRGEMSDPAAAVTYRGIPLGNDGADTRERPSKARACMGAVKEQS